jgi:hypothetical protein
MNGDEHLRLYASKRHFRVEIEGRNQDFLNPIVAEGIEPTGNDYALDNNLLPAAVTDLINHPIDNGDLYLLKSLLVTDLDNNPAPENDRENNHNNNNNNECIYAAAWGHDGICKRRQIGTQNKKPTVLFQASLSPSLFVIFELMLPKMLILDVVLPFMNEQVKLVEVKYREFMRCGV